MAVTKIRKVSSTTLLVLLALSVLIFVLFFAGGSELDAKGNKDYTFTGILLYWTYFLSIATIVATIFFAGRSIATNKTKDAVGRKSNLISTVVLVVSLLAGYFIGSGEAIKGLNEASQAYNTAGWLKVTDMWLYSTYVLFVVTLGAVVWGGVSNRLLGK